MKKILIILSVIFLILLGGCAGCAFWAYKQVIAAQAELDPMVDSFIQKLNERKYADLYAIAKQYDASIDEEKFKADLGSELDKMGHIDSHDQQSFNVQTFNGRTSANISCLLHGSAGNGRLQLSLKKSPDWSVDGFTITHAFGK